jgi:acyl carrier protein
MGEENIIYKIEIIQLIESKYNIEIKDEEVENILTLEDLIGLIKQKSNKLNT